MNIGEGVTLLRNSCSTLYCWIAEGLIRRKTMENHITTVITMCTSQLPLLRKKVHSF